MDVQSVYERLQQLPSLILKINKREREAISILNGLSRLLFGETVVAGCTNCHIKAYHKLTSLTLKDLEVMNARKFKLNKGITIESPVRSGQYFNDATMTDEIAKDFLLNNPKGIKHFAEYPKDAEGNLQLVEPVAEVIEEGKPLSKMNKAELQEKYLEVTGKEAEEDLNKANLIELIENFKPEEN